jgi:hypothetical protein
MYPDDWTRCRKDDDYSYGKNAELKFPSLQRLPEDLIALAHARPSQLSIDSRLIRGEPRKFADSQFDMTAPAWPPNGQYLGARQTGDRDRMASQGLWHLLAMASTPFWTTQDERRNP